MSSNLLDSIVIPANYLRLQKRSDEVCTLCISFKGIEGLQSTKVGPTSTVQLQVCMYDTTYRQFFGRAWYGPEVLTKGQQNAEYKVNVYLHSSIVISSSFLFVVQIIVKQDKKSLLSGWGFIRPFKQGSAPLLDTSDKTPIPTHKMATYYGSPRALPLLNEPIETVDSNLKTIAASLVVYSISHHDALEPVLGYFPENVLVGQNDTVAGILRKDADPFWRPRLQKTVNCLIESIKVVVNPSLQQFEAELRKRLSEDCVNRDNLGESAADIEILERRLHIGVHNGWTYVEPPEILCLTVERARRKSDAAKSSWLSARNKVHVEELVDDKRSLLVFTLEYIVSQPAAVLGHLPGSGKFRSLKKNSARHVFLRVGEVNPLKQPSASEMVLNMHGGSSVFKFSQLLFFKESNTVDSSQLAVDVHFRFSRDDLRRPSVGQLQLPSMEASFIPPTQMIDQEEVEELILKRTLQETASSPSPVAIQPLSVSISATQSPVHNNELTSLTSGALSELTPVALTPLKQPTQAALTHIATVAPPQQLAKSPASVVQSAGGKLSQVYARLYAANFPLILDRNREPPQVLDPVTPTSYQFDMALENEDPLVVNEVVVQFLAFSTVNAPQIGNIKSVYFTFQFYRFAQVVTERLQLSTAGDKTWLSDADSALGSFSAPLILRRTEPKSNTAGYMLRFSLDPASMPVGERRVFVEYLRSQTLHIDMWDGESLMLIGSCAVDLLRLCRQGCEAVQVTHELEVLRTEYLEQPDAQQNNAVPVHMHTTQCGNLHLRLANVGHPIDARLTRRDFSSERRCFVVQANCPNVQTVPRAVVAVPYTSRNRQVAEMLSSRRLQREDTAEETAESPLSDGTVPEQSRKMRRMLLVRREEQTLLGSNAQFQSVMAHRESQNEKARDLQTIDQFRKQYKTELIYEMLQNNATAQHTIWPSFGSAEFFEFKFTNSTDKSVTVYVQCQDPQLHVVPDVTEWQYLKTLHGVDSPLNQHLYNDGQADGGQFSFVAQPRETLFVPFKYLITLADNNAAFCVPQLTESQTQFSTADRSQQSRHVKVLFVLAETQAAIAVLDLHVVPQPHVVDRTFRFYHPEQTFFRKSVRLSPDSNQRYATDSTQLFAISSDPTVICETDPAGITPAPLDVSLKVTLGAAPQIKRFFVAVYGNKFAARPLQLWQFYVHAMQRVDIRCSEGQKTKFSLILRGSQASRLTEVYSSHEDELQLLPRAAFVLAANSTFELEANLKSKYPGHRYMRVHVVDVECRQLLRAWLVCVACKQPLLNKAFELRIPVGGGRESNKSIGYTNPYPTKRTFYLSTNRNELLQFKDAQISIPAGGSELIRLRFMPVSTTGSADILIFINDQDDKTEEAFCIRVTYINV